SSPRSFTWSRYDRSPHPDEEASNVRCRTQLPGPVRSRPAGTGPRTDPARRTRPAHHLLRTAVVEAGGLQGAGHPRRVRFLPHPLLPASQQAHRPSRSARLRPDDRPAAPPQARRPATAAHRPRAGQPALGRTAPERAGTPAGSAARDTLRRDSAAIGSWHTPSVLSIEWEVVHVASQSYDGERHVRARPYPR